MHNVITVRLPELMASRREKISHVARETGISRTTLTKLYYQKGTSVSFDVLEKLCGHFDCPVSELLGRSPAPDER